MKKRLSALLATIALVTATPAWAQAPMQDPALQQTVTDQEVIEPLGTPAVIDAGHADLGPMIIDGQLEFLVRDDSQEQPVWRHIEDVVFPVGDNALTTLPEGDEFDFTGASGGEDVWVVPQTEVPGVVWLGWNTQHPSVVELADRGVTMNYLGHQGPGQYTLFLQAGGFAKPQQLFTSASDTQQSMWAEINTHTHANWVFTEPGVHQVALELVVQQVDGTEMRDTKILKFAVGDTSVEEAAAATWEGEMLAEETTADSASSSQGSNTVLWVGIGLLVVTVVLILGALLMKRSAAGRRNAAVSGESKK
ncbi:choice-of-anchor M domain-containing protein [Corynebacterium hindlerae]|uniref:choice-of-anchor M domain-containing protein n=1 Tax=Corynebacterium hindlerae TaxID=699041 RepID=UPI0031B691B0